MLFQMDTEQRTLFVCDWKDAFSIFLWDKCEIFSLFATDHYGPLDFKIDL